jgi:hypothetical protein
VHQAGGSGHLLSLSVAAADPDRPGGDWALWTGRIQQARLDRGGDQTLLKVEGVDVKQEVTERERLVSVHGRPTFAGGYEATPKYETERSSHPVYIPNGREFFVRYPHARESIVTMRTISVFGRFMGRDKGEALPAIDALVVIKREEQQ